MHQAVIATLKNIKPINGDVTIEISARGTCYILGDTKEDFIRQCEKDNVEFIEPNISILVS